MQNARHIGGNEGLAFPYANHHRRAKAGGNDLVRFGGRKNTQSESSSETLHRAAYGLFQQSRSTCSLGIFLHLLDEVSDDLGVRLRYKFVTLRGQFAFQVKIVFDDAVMHDDDPTCAIAVWMRILFRGAPMCGPPSVADTEGSLQRMFFESVFQVAQLSRCATHLENGRIRAAHRDSRRVVPAVFKAPEPLNNDRDNLLRTDVPYDSTHKRILCDRGKSTVTGK